MEELLVDFLLVPTSIKQSLIQKEGSRQNLH